MAETVYLTMPIAGIAADFMGRPAVACRFAEQPAVIAYRDAGGHRSMRAVTFDEVLEQHGLVYLSGYCRERFERRHFRLDRIEAMRRFDDGALVDPGRELLRWISVG